MTAAASIVPSNSQPIADARGRVTTEWQRFFNALVRAAALPQSVLVGTSPYSYTAPGFGSVAVSGGTVSSITLQRGVTVVPTGITSGLIPVANGDIIEVTYSGLPTVNFIPG